MQAVRFVGLAETEYNCFPYNLIFELQYTMVATLNTEVFISNVKSDSQQALREVMAGGDQVQTWRGWDMWGMRSADMPGFDADVPNSPLRD